MKTTKISKENPKILYIRPKEIEISSDIINLCKDIKYNIKLVDYGIVTHISKSTDKYLKSLSLTGLLQKAIDDKINDDTIHFIVYRKSNLKVWHLVSLLIHIDKLDYNSKYYKYKELFKDLHKIAVPTFKAKKMFKGRSFSKKGIILSI